MGEKKHFHKFPVDGYSDFRDAAELTQRIFAAIDDVDDIQDKAIEGEVKLDLTVRD